MTSSQTQIYKDFNTAFSSLIGIKGNFVKWSWVPDSFDYAELCIFLNLNVTPRTVTKEASFDFNRFEIKQEKTHKTLRFFEYEFGDFDYMKIEVLR